MAAFVCKYDRFELELVALANVCPKAKNGVLTPIIYIFYSKIAVKQLFR